MARVSIRLNSAGFRELLRDPDVLSVVRDVAENVAAEARATASEAENGAGGTIDGYAAAGFTVATDMNAKRPDVRVISNADLDTFLRAHFHSQRKHGVAHLRAALYKFTDKA